MKLALIALGLAAAASPAMAQDISPQWTVDLGAVGRVRPSHLGSRQYVTDVVPVLEATYGDRLQLSLDDGAKWTALKLGPVGFGPIAEYRQSFADDLPRGAFRMANTVELGGFGEVTTPVGVLEARLRRAVNGYSGWSGDLAFSTGAQVTPKFQVGGQLRLAWADSSFSQEYFGLKPHAATHAGLPRFLDNDYWSAGAELGAAHSLTANTRIVLQVSADRMLGEIPASPLFRTRNIYVTSVGLTWRWRSR